MTSPIVVHTLQNGVRVVMESIPFVRSVSFGLWVDNGSRHENNTTSGMSHFIEHMLFKGTDKRTALEIADTMDAVGGQLNAFTSKEHTCYFTRTLDTHFDTALDVLSDMFFNSKFDSGEIDKERNVILEEVSMYEDTPEDLCVDLLHAKIYSGHPLGMPILGTPDTIGSLSRNDFVNFLQARYTPQNLVIAIAGNINAPAVLEKVTKAFGSFQGNATPDVPQKAIYTPGYCIKEKDIEQVHLAMGFPSIPVGTDESYVLAAVNTIFGGGMSSRLFQKIREEHGLVYTVYSYNSSYADTGIFMVYAALNPANLPEVLELISGQIKGMFTDKITAQQLTKAKEQLKSNFLLSLESAAARMNSIGRAQIVLNRILTPDELVAKIDGINLDTFYATCENVLKLDQVSMSLVGKNINSDVVSMVKQS